MICSVLEGRPWNDHQKEAGICSYTQVFMQEGKQKGCKGQARYESLQLSLKYLWLKWKVK